MIQTDDPGPQNPGGFAYLFGANVANYGTINVPNGEVALVSARTITFTPNSDAAASFPTAVLPAGVTVARNRVPAPAIRKQIP